MLQMEIGGAGFQLDPAAVSCIRYRAAYGDSIINHLSACGTARAFEGRLLRMCHVMIPAALRPALPDLARLARRDTRFLRKGLDARDALLAGDPRNPAEGDGAEPFDEYQVLAMLAVSGVDMGLLYELPILHLLSVVRRAGDLRDPENKRFRAMTGPEMARLYPRRR